MWTCSSVPFNNSRIGTPWTVGSEGVNMSARFSIWVHHTPLLQCVKNCATCRQFWRTTGAHNLLLTTSNLPQEFKLYASYLGEVYNDLIAASISREIYFAVHYIKGTGLVVGQPILNSFSERSPTNSVTSCNYTHSLRQTSPDLWLPWERKGMYVSQRNVQSRLTPCWADRLQTALCSHQLTSTGGHTRGLYRVACRVDVSSGEPSRLHSAASQTSLC